MERLEIQYILLICSGAKKKKNVLLYLNSFHLGNNVIITIWNEQRIGTRIPTWWETYCRLWLTSGPWSVHMLKR